MSKKRKIQLKRGKYYASYPNGGYPSLIYRKNKKKNKYDAVVFETTPGHHKKELDHPISPSVKQSVIQTRPIRGTRSDFGDRELQGLEINKSDKPKIEMVKRRIPQETRKYREYKEKKRQASKSQLDAVSLLKLIADNKSRKNKNPASTTRWEERF